MIKIEGTGKGLLLLGMLFWGPVQPTPLAAHNGAVALAVPIEGIVVDGDFSDWPTDLVRYSIEQRVFYQRLEFEGDLKANFRVGYSMLENALFLAVEVEDESVMVDTTGEWETQDLCWIDLVIPHQDTEKHQQAYGHYAMVGNTPKILSPGLDLDDFRVAVKRTKSAHYYEWRLDIDPQMGLGPGQSIGLDVVLRDQDQNHPTPNAHTQGQLNWAQGYWARGDVVLAAKADEYGHLKGRVRWRKGEGVGRIRIKFIQVENEGVWGYGRTDRQGNFALDLPVGSYRIEAETALVDPRPINATVEAGASITLPDLFVEAGGRIVSAGPGKKLEMRPGRRVQAGAGQWQGLWQTLAVEDGLTRPSVTAMVQDRDGFVWFAYKIGGITRYDGREFVHYTTAEGLPGDLVRALLLDRVGNLWIGTDAGLVRYDGNEFVHFTSADGLLNNQIVSLLEARSGDIWIAAGELDAYSDDFAANSGVCRYTGTTFECFTAAEGLVHNAVRTMAEDQQGHLWFGTFRGVSRFDGRHFTNFTSEDGLADVEITAIVEDRQGHLWFGSIISGLSRFAPEGTLNKPAGKQFTTFTDIDGLPCNDIMALSEDRQGHLWIGTDQCGLGRYDGHGFTTYTEEDGIAQNRIMSIMEDHSGHLWLGTGGWSSYWGASGKGVSRYIGSEIGQITGKDGLSHIGILSVAVDRGGQVWLGTWGGLNRYDGREITKIEGANRHLRAIAEDGHGRLWFGVYGQGICRYEGGELKWFTKADGLVGNIINELLVDNKGHLWIGTSEGLSRYDGKEFVNFTAADGLPDKSVQALGLDRQGHIWIGSRKGLSRLDGKEFVTYTTADGLPDNWVLAIAADRQGRLWLGTHNGLSRYDGKEFTNFTTADGLSNPNVEAILADRRGHMWFGTGGGGVSRYDGLVFQSFMHRDGLPHNSVMALAQDQNGDVWIATQGGATHYRHQEASPPIRITDVITDRARGGVEQVEMPSSQQYLAFKFRGLSFKTRPNQLAYVYRLKGFEDEWQVTRHEQVEYAALPVGEYIFEVKAVDRDLNYSKKPATVALKVVYQPLVSPLRIAAVALNPLFASFYKTYDRQSIGNVELINDRPDSAQVTLEFYIPELMRRRSRQDLVLPPLAGRSVALKASLDVRILELETEVQRSVEITLSFKAGDDILSIAKTKDIRVHGQGALRWDSVARAAAFITSTDPAVIGFANPALIEFEAQLKALGKPGKNLLQAMLLFEALKQHGVRYRPDANTPYTQPSANRAVVDYIQYPAQTLQRKAGDCDDLTVLYCSLLENAGIATALVDYPEHIFLLFDSGVHREERYQLPWPAAQYVPLGDRLWIPLEITRLDGSFRAAWKAGSNGLNQFSSVAQRQRIVATATAWEAYPAVEVAGSQGVVESPAPALLQAAYSAQYSALQAEIDEYIDETYLDRLKAEPDNDALRTRLLKVYLALNQVELAVDRAARYLLEERGDMAATHNHLGHARFLQGEIAQAAYHYKQAAALRPQDKGIQRNLERALAAGDLGAVKGKDSELGQESTSGSKGAAAQIDIDDFYWLEE